MPCCRSLFRDWPQPLPLAAVPPTRAPVQQAGRAHSAGSRIALTRKYLRPEVATSGWRQAGGVHPWEKWLRARADEPTEPHVGYKRTPSAPDLLARAAFGLSRQSASASCESSLLSSAAVRMANTGALLASPAEACYCCFRFSYAILTSSWDPDRHPLLHR